MKVYIAGIGMEGIQNLTVQAEKAIESSDLLIGSKRVLEPFCKYGKKFVEEWRAEEIRKILLQSSCDTVTVLFSGDVGFYSGASKLIHELKEFDTDVISGISSPVYFSSKTGIPWQNMKFISLHGEKSNIVRSVCRNEYCFFLLGGEVTPSDICSRLCDYKMGDTEVFIGENLGYEDEKILSGKAHEFTDLKIGKLAVMVCVNHEYERSIPHGIPDEKFIRSDVPMSKSEIRISAVSKLAVLPADVCWDVGCGTGAVSVEMALNCYEGKVCSVDLNKEAVELTRKNSIEFGCDNIEVSEGRAPQCLESFPKPDKVFIGGSCGEVGGIMDIALRKNPYTRFVITAVSLETLEETRRVMERLNMKYDVVQLAVTDMIKRGSHTMFSAKNPVFIIRGEMV